METNFEIYFCDLNVFAQNDLLKVAGVNDPSEMNWDVFPITTISFDREAGE